MLAKVGRLFLVMSGKFKLRQVESVYIGYVSLRYVIS